MYVGYLQTANQPKLPTTKQLVMRLIGHRKTRSFIVTTYDELGQGH